MKSRLYISRENLRGNIEYIKNKIGNKKDIIAMVKANAYGVGDTIMASELQKIGINAFGVANVEEGIRLRKANIYGMIIVTSVVLKEEIKNAIENDISLSVSSLENIKEIERIANECGKIANIHLKIDTGMTRLGFKKDSIIVNFPEILSCKNIHVQGIYTHLSCADMDREYTLTQIDTFKNVLNELKKKYDFEYIHILNSDGVENYSSIVDFDTHVRVGIIMHGYVGNTKPILKLTAPIIHIACTDMYTKVSYGGTYIAKPNTKIAVLKIGYADGIARCLSNKLSVNINGIECPQIGNICMDMMMVNITEVPDAKVGDEAIIFDYTNDLKDIAKKSNKIVYEVISSLGNRIERIVE